MTKEDKAIYVLMTILTMCIIIRIGCIIFQ